MDKFIYLVHVWFFFCVFWQQIFDVVNNQAIVIDKQSLVIKKQADDISRLNRIVNSSIGHENGKLSNLRFGVG